MQNKIREIINDFCDNLNSFTSLDVSNAVKQEGFPDSRHRDVAPVVRQMFADGELDDFGYTRTLIDVELLSGLKTKTNLYHHVSISTDAYLDRKQVAIPPKAKKVDKPQPAPVPAPTTFSFGYGDSSDQNEPDDDQDDDQNDSNEIECLCKTDGRLEIPVGWVRSMPWYSGFEIIFEFEDDKIVAFAKNSGRPDGTFLGSIVISSDRRVRIPKTVFMKAGFDYSAKSSHLITKCTGCFEIEDSE